MFVLKRENTFSWPVRVKVPGGDGRHETHTFRAIFRPAPGARLKEMGEEDPSNANAVILREVVVGWKDGEVRDEDGAPIPFSDQALEDLIAIDYVAVALARAYGEAITGLSGEKIAAFAAKNSGRRPSAGPPAA